MQNKFNGHKLIRFKNMLSKKNLIYLSIVIFIIVAFFYNSETKSIYNNIMNIINVNLLGNSTIANKNFHINDISSIDKIILEDRFRNKIVLKLTKKKWMVNDKYKVRSDAMTTLLSSANEIRIKSPVSKKSIKSVTNFIKTSGVKVEFFNSTDLVKSYIIGSSTPDHLGTYMVLKNSSEPFVMHIPTHNGFLSPRYGIQSNKLDLKRWRDNKVFNFKSKDINLIQYINYNDSSLSYSLKSHKEIFDFNGRKIKHNPNKVSKFLNSFSTLNCETYKEEEENNITNLNPIEQLIVNQDTLVTFSFKNNQSTENKNISRKYAKLNNGELMIIQDYVFNKVLININDLRD